MARDNSPSGRLDRALMDLDKAIALAKGVSPHELFHADPDERIERVESIVHPKYNLRITTERRVVLVKE